MSKEAKLLVVLDENGIHTEIIGTASDIMFMAEKALTESRKAIEKKTPVNHEDAVRLMDEVIKNYEIEAALGEAAAAAIALEELLKYL